MTRALWWAAWVFGVIAAVAFLLLLRELFVVTAILAALAAMGWGFRVHPNHHFVTTKHPPNRGRSVMAYEYETTEWNRAMYGSTETELDIAANSHRAAVGQCGDRSDALDEIGGRR
ncbi:hypothetical protein [Mycolicibacterium conceptionense]|uniref:hypothetical protein n=1 Tax=Mycolicibacterium conceptionense TaxID=451644 RepID=UPI00096F8BC7|nr:hypothetical protein [Mycolicibacterium conceptionense]OMB79232.1 hypothetical protein A5743_14095 [Mycolicibacterium conceptionense]